MGRIPYLHTLNTESKTSMEIESEGCVKEFTANQAIGTGSWRKLGVFELAPGATLKLFPGKSYGVVIADGFALVPNGE